MLVQICGGFLVLGGLMECTNFVLNDTTFGEHMTVVRARLGLAAMALGLAMLVLCAWSVP